MQCGPGLDLLRVTSGWNTHLGPQVHKVHDLLKLSVVLWILGVWGKKVSCFVTQINYFFSDRFDWPGPTSSFKELMRSTGAQAGDRLMRAAVGQLQQAAFLSSLLFMLFYCYFMLCFFISPVSLVCQMVLPKLKGKKKKAKAFELGFLTPVVFAFLKNVFMIFSKDQNGLLVFGGFVPHKSSCFVN